MTTLFEIAKRVVEELGDAHHGKATGGAVDEVVDTIGLAGFPEDYFQYHGLFVLEADGVAPEGEFTQIVDYSPGSFTVTLYPSLSAAVAAGDQYMLTSPRYPLNDVIAAINQGLHRLGPIPLNDTSLTTASQQTELSLPSTVRDVYEVWVQGYNGDPDDNAWVKQYGWRIERAAIGSQDTLIFPYQPAPDMSIKLVYMGEHPDVFDPTDEIANVVEPRALSAYAVMHLIRNRMRKAVESDPKLRQQLEQVTAEYERLMADNPIVKPHRTARIFTLGSRRRRLTSGY